MEPMRIAFLAPSQAGKTSHIVTLYGMLTQELNTNPDYSIKFEILDQIKKRFLEEKYTKLSNEPGYDFEPSSKIVEYPCRLHLEQDGYTTASIDVILVDFPGETLLGAKNEDTQEDVENIIKALSQCDGFIVLLDADAILLGLEKGGARVSVDKMKANNVRQILKKAMQRRRETPISYEPDQHAFGRGETPIVFAVTKGDKLQTAIADNTEAAEWFIKELYSNRRQEHKFTDKAIAPALIQHQFADFINHKYVTSMQLVTSLYRPDSLWLSPQQVEHPFQFVLFVGIQNAIAEYEERQSYWNKKANKANNEYHSDYQNKTSVSEALNRRKNMSFWKKITKGGSRTHELESSLEKKEEKYKASKQIKNANDAQKKRASQYYKEMLLFYQHILSDKLAYLLSQGTTTMGFHQRGIVIHMLKGKKWWEEKIKAGEIQYKTEKQEQKYNKKEKAA